MVLLDVWKNCPVVLDDARPIVCARVRGRRIAEVVFELDRELAGRAGYERQRLICDRNLAGRRRHDRLDLGCAGGKLLSAAVTVGVPTAVSV